MLPPPGYQGAASASEAGRVHEIIDRWLKEDLKQLPSSATRRSAFSTGFAPSTGSAAAYDREGLCARCSPPGHGQALRLRGCGAQGALLRLRSAAQDACYVRASTAEAWIDGHVHAFAFFGGVAIASLRQRPRCHRDASSTGSSLCAIDGRPGKGNDKGESLVGFSRRNSTASALCHGKRSIGGLTVPPPPRYPSAREPCLRGLRPLPGQVSSSDQRLLGAGGLWPSRRLGARLRRPGGDRLRRSSPAIPGPMARERTEPISPSHRRSTRRRSPDGSTEIRWRPLAQGGAAGVWHLRLLESWAGSHGREGASTRSSIWCWRPPKLDLLPYLPKAGHQLHVPAVGRRGMTDGPTS